MYGVPVMAKGGIPLLACQISVAKISCECESTRIVEWRKGETDGTEREEERGGMGGVSVCACVYACMFVCTRV